MRERRWVAVWLSAAVLLLLTVLIWRFAVNPAQSPPPPAPAPSAVGGPFTLVDQSGAPVNEGILRGKWSAVFFGYTYCPDVCPTTLAALGGAQAALGGRASKFQVVFISIDPARDTPKALGAYLASAAFPRGARGLTGSPEQTARVAKAYHVYIQKVGDGANYTMDHSSVVYLMDPQGRFVRPLSMGVPPSAIAQQIAAAMDEG